MEELIEEWRAVVGFEGFYEVSNLGRVKSLKRVIVDSLGRKRVFKGQLLSCSKDKLGYPVVTLMANGISKSIRVHRLVATAFIPNPNNYEIVNHKDETRDNNSVDNLEWCSFEYNINYGTARKRNTLKKMRPVNQYTLDGELIATYGSQTEAQQKTGASKYAISRCCLGVRPTAFGYRWSYA